MTTAEETAINEARALRLILATLQADTDNATATQASHMVFDEIDCVECLIHLASTLAAIAAEEMACAYGPKKAARELERQIAARLDFAEA